MPDYIADALHSIANAKPPKRAPKFKASPFPDLFADIRNRVGDLQSRALYAFDYSALNAASDLRIDTPDRVDRLVGAVLAEERQVFLEANAAEMGVINRNLRGLLTPFPDAPDPNFRFGAFVDIHGDGRASFQIVTQNTRQSVLTSGAGADLLRESRGLEGSLSDPAQSALRLKFGSFRADIDIRRHIGMSREEFGQAFEKMGPGRDPIAHHGAKVIAAASGVRERGRLLDDTWRAVRFRDMLRVAPLEGAASVDDSKIDPRLDALRSGLPIIAMLAVLAAEGGDLRSAPRARESRKTKGGERAKSAQAPGLRVVTLNLEDREMQKVYESYVGATDVSPGQESETGRARHPVRGHLFLARNGRMTWRKPHWRGSLERPLLHRVIAPSHRK
jgi:hypothetical protein